MDGNPYQAPLAPGANAVTVSIERGRRLFWGLIAALMGLAVFAMVAMNIRQGQFDWATVPTVLVYGALCYWLGRGGWIAKWVFVSVMLVQLPVGVVILLTYPFQWAGTMHLSLEMAVRSTFAGMLVLSRDLNAYLAFWREQRRVGAAAKE